MNPLTLSVIDPQYDVSSGIAPSLLPEQAPCLRVEALLTVENRLGFHARPAALFVRLVSRFHCEVDVSNGNDIVSGQSLLGLLVLGASKGTRLRVGAEGREAAEAIEALSELFRQKFGED